MNLSKTTEFYTLKGEIFSWAWWLLLIISALRRWRQEDCKFKANLGYVERPYQRKKEKNEGKKERREMTFTV
jgi:hypothetical protein